MIDLRDISTILYHWTGFKERRSSDGSAVLLITGLPVTFVLILGEQLSHIFLLLTNQLVDVIDFLAFLLSLAEFVEFVLRSQHEQNQRIRVYNIQLMGKKIKTCLIGDSTVGKTSILLRVIDGCFKENNPSTIGADYKSEVKKIEGEDVIVQLWDTSGQDKYRSVAKNFFRGSDGIFIVFSLEDDQSLQGLEYWIEQAKEVLDASVPKILLGNKADLVKQPSPKAQKVINQLVKEGGFIFYKVSAKTGLNIKEAYQTLVNLGYKYMKANGTSESVFIPRKPQKSKGCC